VHKVRSIRLLVQKRTCILTEMGTLNITTCVLSSRGYLLLLTLCTCSLTENVGRMIPAKVKNTVTTYKRFLCHVCFYLLCWGNGLCYVILVLKVLLLLMLHNEISVSWEETCLAIWLLFAGNLVIMRVIFLVSTRRCLYIVRKKIYQYIEEENRVIQNRIW
jgi:hypothetical protein